MGHNKIMKKLKWKSRNGMNFVNIYPLHSLESSEWRISNRIMLKRWMLFLQDLIWVPLMKMIKRLYMAVVRSPLRSISNAVHWLAGVCKAYGATQMSKPTSRNRLLLCCPPTSELYLTPCILYRMVLTTVRLRFPLPASRVMSSRNFQSRPQF